MSESPLDQQIAAAEPAEDAIDREWVRFRSAAALFESHQNSPPTVGRYQLGDRLGAGGMGVVYAAKDPELDRDVAVKLIRVNAADDRDETHAEAQALARVTHPNVVAIHDVGIVDDQVYIVMEFVRGQTLRAFASDADVTALVDAYRQAGEGLAAAHREGLIHRDFKPDNALIGDDGRVRVIDFGLAHEHDTDARRPTAGTPQYMAPEQVNGDVLTAAVDQFALCASLHEALTMDCEALPAWLEPTISRGLAPDASERFNSLDDLLEQLALDPRKRRRRRIAVGAALALTMLAFVGGALAFGGDANGDRCEGGLAELESVWAAEGRQAAFEKMSTFGDYGASLAPRLETITRTFTTEWTQGHRAACLAHQRGEQSAELLDKRMTCLARQGRSLAQFAEVAQATTPDALADLAVAAQSLPSPDDCSDIDALSRRASPPAAIADEVASLEAKLAEARITLAAGEYERAAADTTTVLEKARSLEHAPLLAQALLLRGRAAMDRSQLPAAMPLLREATEVALASGDDRIAIEAWARRAWVEGNTSDPRVALNGRELIEPLTQRVGATFESGLFFNNIGSVEIAAGDKTAARRYLEKAVEISEKVEGPGALELVNSRGNLAIVTESSSARDRLASESIESLTRLVGPDHPRTFAAILGRALLMNVGGKGHELLANNCGRLRALHPALHRLIADCFSELGWFATLENDSAAVAAMRIAGGYEEAPVARALAALLSGDDGLAVDQLRALLSATPSPLPDAPWWATFRYAEIEMALGYAQMKQGSSQGRARLEQAADRIESLDEPVPTVGRRLAVARRWLEEAP